MGTDDDIKELWQGIDEVRVKLNSNSEVLVSIKTLLEERCSVRGALLCNLEERVKDLERRVWWASGGAAAIAALASSLLGKLLRGD